jgi:hypothetical protein
MHPAAQTIPPMSGRGRSRAGRPPIVAPNGRAALRRNDEASLSCVAVKRRSVQITNAKGGIRLQVELHCRRGRGRRCRWRKLVGLPGGGEGVMDC